jgi:subtilisin family serine protease
MFRRTLLLLFMCCFFAFSSEAGYVSLPVKLLMQKGTKGIPGGLLKFDENNRVELLVETDNPQEIKEWLRLNRGNAGSYAGGILTVRVPVELLSDFIRGPSVFRVMPSRKLKPLLDISRQKISADEAEQGLNLPRGITGVDAIVGIVDTGIDFTHPDFKNPDGSTRIIALWDQTINGIPPADFGYGAECTVDSINNGSCTEIDTDPDFSHGTHVAGIAAGSHSTYRGIAPSAMIVAVKSLYTEGAVIDGVDYVFRIAQKYKKPAVVNLSLGGNYGPHDGTGELARALTALEGTGRVIVAAGGNSGDMYIHAGGNVTSEKWFVMDFDSGNTTAGLDIWYDGADALDFGVVALRQNNQLCGTPAFVAPGQSGQFTMSCANLNCGTVYLDASEVSYSGNGDRNVLIVLQSPSSSEELSKCRWALGVKPNSSDPSGGNFDAWIITDNGEFTDSPVPLTGLVVSLSSPGDTDKTVSTPADAKNIIAVGSYVSKTQWPAKDGNSYTCEPNCVENDISYFSSRGPTRDGRIKPDIVAPGEWIASAKSANVMEIPSYLLLPDNEHFMLAGTSMASPHVTGAVALLFDMNPQLSLDEVRQFLTGNTDTDIFTGTVPNNVWGYGKLNIEKALLNVSPVGFDNTPPVISNVLIDMQEGSVNISWDTDELANGLVKITYGNGDDISWSMMSYSIGHMFSITGIDTGRVFRIEISSSDPRGNSSSVTNLLGILPHEGCGCNYSGGNGVGFAFLLLLPGLIGVLYIRNRLMKQS